MPSMASSQDAPSVASGEPLSVHCSASPKVTARRAYEENPVAADGRDAQSGDVRHVRASELHGRRVREHNDLLRVGGSDELVPDAQPEPVTRAGRSSERDVVSDVPTSTVPDDGQPSLRRGVGVTARARRLNREADRERDDQHDDGRDELHPPRPSPQYDRSIRIRDDQERRERAEPPRRPTSNRPPERLNGLRQRLARNAVDGWWRRRPSPPHSTSRCLPARHARAKTLQTFIRLAACAQRGALRRGRRWRGMS